MLVAVQSLMRCVSEGAEVFFGGHSGRRAGRGPIGIGPCSENPGYGARGGGGGGW